MPVYKDEERNTYYYAGKYIDIFGNQRNYRKRGFKSSSLAKEAERKFLLKATEKVTDRYTFNELVYLFLEYKKDRVKPRTIYDYTKLIDKQLIPFFGKMYVNRITIPFIEKWQQHLLEQDYSNSYLETIQTNMSSLMNFAVRKQMIKANPFQYIEFVKHVNKAKPTMKFWTLEEYNMFNSAIDAEEDRVLFDLLYWTGMRISELQARTWKDLHFSHGSLNIHSNFDNKNKAITAVPKNGSNRIIYLNKTLLESLRMRHIEHMGIDDYTEDRYIFGFYKPIAHKTVENKKNKYISRYNENNPNSQIPAIRLHDFRHSHVSLLINNDVDTFTIAERLGHSKDMVEKKYAHMFPEKKKEILSVLDKF